MSTIIRNSSSLAKSKAAKDALGIISAGLQAANPALSLGTYIANNKLRLAKTTLKLEKYSRVCLVAYGKAACSMAEIADANAKISDGIVIIPNGTRKPKLDSRYKVYTSSHPIPDSKSVIAAKAILEITSTLGINDYVIFLVSGGGSAMIALPSGVTLSDKIKVNKLLLQVGASIAEINCLRRRISGIKGGKLVSGLKCRGATFLMSDVKGNKPYDIASGCTQSDPTTFADALDVIKKYKLTQRIPKRVILALKAGTKQGKNIKYKCIPNIVIATNENCLRAMSIEAKRRKYNVILANIYGDIETVAARIIKKIPKKPMSCVIFGGETSVNVQGNGKGGRSQELVARILMGILDAGLVCGSVGTDGIDGNTRAAGAIAESTRIANSEIAKYLSRNDSYRLFLRHGNLVITGPTGTNLQDIGILIRRE